MRSPTLVPRRPLADLVPLGSLVAAALVAGVLGAASGCATTSFDGSRFDDGKLVFRVGALPPSYERLSPKGALLAFRDPSAGDVVLVNARCDKDGDDVPLEALRAHILLSFTEREIVAEEKRMLDGREALYTRLTAKLDGVQRAFHTLVVKKDGCVFDFVAFSPRDLDATGPAFERLVQGFHLERRP